MEDRGLCRSCPILGLVATLSCAGFSAAGKRDEVDRAWPFWRGDAIVSHPSKPSTDIWELPLTCYWQGCTFCLSSVFIWFCYGWCCSSCWQAKVGGTKLVDLIFKSFWYSDPCSTSNCSTSAAVPLPQKAIWRHTHCGRRGGGVGFTQLVLLLLLLLTDPSFSEAFLLQVEKGSNLGWDSSRGLFSQQGSNLLLPVN